MGPLLLLFSCWTLVGAQTPFTIRGVTLAIEPGNDLQRGANATLRCRAAVSSSGSQALSHTYTFYKDDSVVYTLTRDSSEVAYSIPAVRYSNTGKYKCRVDIYGEGRSSDPSKLTVTGVAAPLLHLEKARLSEGEEVTVKCYAPDETGSIIFYFYADGREVAERRAASNQAEAMLHFDDAGVHRVHCDYAVILLPGFAKSNASNVVSVSVRALPFQPVLELSPATELFEGDTLRATCRLEGYHQDPRNFELSLTHGSLLLSQGQPEINGSVVVNAEDAREMECSVTIGNIVKNATKTLSVIELFSVPRLSVSPAEVFTGDQMLLTCSSDILVPGKLSTEDITYAMDNNVPVQGRKPGLFSGRAPPYNHNYSCTAVARGIQKRSKAVQVKPKVSVVKPKISVVGRVIQGRPFQIKCLSERGSLPIHYSLFDVYNQVNSTTVSLPSQEALFTVTIQSPGEIHNYVCEAANNQKNSGVLSDPLNTTVIVPLSNATLTVLPIPGDVSEGNTLTLICGVQGSPPVTFKWYRQTRGQFLFSGSTTKDHMHHQIVGVDRDDSDTYYCEAINAARNQVRSQQVLIEVRLALWKKALIAVALLVPCVLALVCVLYYRSRRGKKEVPTELSVKPPSSKSDDSLTVSLTHDTEVYTAATVTVDRTTSSMWSVRPATAASDEESSDTSHEPDVEYTEVVHPRSADPAKVVLKKGTETVYTELQTSPLSVAAAAADQEYGSLQYAELNNVDPLACRHDNDHHCLPGQVD